MKSSNEKFEILIQKFEIQTLNRRPESTKRFWCKTQYEKKQVAGYKFWCFKFFKLRIWPHFPSSALQRVNHQIAHLASPRPVRDGVAWKLQTAWKFQLRTVWSRLEPFGTVWNRLNFSRTVAHLSSTKNNRSPPSFQVCSDCFHIRLIVFNNVLGFINKFRIGSKCARECWQNWSFSN